MAPFKKSLLAITVLLLSVADAHFELVKPPPLEGGNMNEDLQTNAPCGGGVPNLSQDPGANFHVDGDSVAVLLLHPQATWLIRATLDPDGAGNWTQLFPIVTQSGRGEFCEPAVVAPKEWAGKRGLISTVCKAPDGMLFQCAAVNFVEGTSAPSDTSNCRNGSAVSVSFDSDPALASLVGSPVSTNTPTPQPDSSAPSLLASRLAAGTFAATAFAFLGGIALF